MLIKLRVHTTTGTKPMLPVYSVAKWGISASGRESIDRCEYAVLLGS